MTRLSAIAMILVLFVQAAGFHLLSIVRIRSWKSEIKERLIQDLPDGKLQRLSLKETDSGLIHWEERLHKIQPTARQNVFSAKGEFFFDGQLFDLVRLEVTESGCDLICFNDSGEKDLKAKISDDLQDLSKRKQSFSFFSFCYLPMGNLPELSIEFETVYISCAKTFTAQNFFSALERPPASIV